MAGVLDSLEVLEGICTFACGDFPTSELVEAKRSSATRVQVCIPAKDEEATIGSIVSTVRRELVDDLGLVDDLVVVDDASRDATARRARGAGARVVAGPGLGKGQAMEAGVAALSELSERGDGSPEGIVVFLDGDVDGFEACFVTGMLGPLLCSPAIELVKGCYRRPIGDDPHGGGRVTELVAKPALELCFPALGGLRQPLAGETAARASLLRDVRLAPGYAVEVALLIDAYRLRGTRAIAEVDLGVRRHRNRPLAALVPQAKEVLATILERSGAL